MTPADFERRLKLKMSAAYQAKVHQAEYGQLTPEAYIKAAEYMRAFRDVMKMIIEVKKEMEPK